jgi:hypothetical protein
MPGYAQAQVMSPDGRQLYTFYASAEPISGDDGDGDEYHAWIHVLNLEHGWAHCLELDEKIGVDAIPALAVSADSKQLYVSDRATGAMVAIDTGTLRVERTRFVPRLHTDVGALLAADGPTLFLNTGLRGVTRVDARTLEPEPGFLAPTHQVIGLHVDASGRALYVLASDGLFVLAPDGKELERWSAPGDATAIAPPAAPGRGTYGCAC